MNENLIVSDFGNHNVRKVDLSEKRVTTIAGRTEGSDEGEGHANDKGTSARFNHPRYVEVDGRNDIFVTEKGSLRKISCDDGAVTTEGYNDECNMVDNSEVQWFLRRLGYLKIDDEGNLVCVDIKDNMIIAFNFRLKPKLNKYSPRCDGAKCMSRNVVSVSCLNGAKRCGRVRCGAERCGVANP